MASEDQESEAPPEADMELQCPKLFFETITFSDNTTLALEEDDIVVFVGPNNAGKSAALRELEQWISRSHSGHVIKNATMTKRGTQEDLRAYLEVEAQKSGSLADICYGGIGYNIHHSHLVYFDNPKVRWPRFVGQPGGLAKVYSG